MKTSHQLLCYLSSVRAPRDFRTDYLQNYHFILFPKREKQPENRAICIQMSVLCMLAEAQSSPSDFVLKVYGNDVSFRDFCRISYAIHILCLRFG